MKTLALCAIALASLTTAALAEDASSYVTFPNVVRCQSCGAEYHIKARVMKDNTIQLKAELINKKANPKVH
jgi:hypothetical protein